MNALHFHLIITHLPIFASLLGAMVLAYGMLKDSKTTREAAYFILILAGIGTVLSNISGENAEELAETISGITESSIEEHEESVSLVFWTLVPSAVAALLSLLAGWKKPEFEKKLGMLAIVFALFGFAAVARTAWLGGQIRHSEIRSGTGFDDFEE